MALRYALLVAATTRGCCSLSRPTIWGGEDRLNASGLGRGLVKFVPYESPKILYSVLERFPMAHTSTVREGRVNMYPR